MIHSFEGEPSYAVALEKAKTHPAFKTLKYIDNLQEFLDSDIEIRKIFSCFTEEEIVKKLKKAISKDKNLAVTSSFVDNIEITDKDAQKGIMLAKVAKKYGLKKEEVMIMGDSFNDYSMFTEFTETVAMGNALDEIKDIAKYITVTNDEAGVAVMINKVLKGEI